MLNQLHYINDLHSSVQKLSLLAFEEDAILNDHFDQLNLSYDKPISALIIAKQDAVFAGAEWLNSLFETFLSLDTAHEVQYECFKKDGDSIQKGETIIELNGLQRSVLRIERTMLNFLSRCIGIATLTNQYVKKVKSVHAHINLLDTRKTIPGFRYLDKYAVTCGGGKNHRLNLADMIMLKENNLIHMDAQDLKKLIAGAKSANIPVEIEVSSLNELENALNYNCDQVMLDNFTPEQIERASNFPKGDIKIEVSGGITLETIESFCHPYVDYISVGSITHSAPVADLSLLIK